MVLHRMAVRLLAQLLPPACPLCLQTLPFEWTDVFCGSCMAGLAPLPASRCTRCALPFESAVQSEHLCSRCIQSPPPFRKAFAVGHFDGSLRKAIHQFKFNQRVNLDRPLARLLNRVIAEQDYDLIVPVPIHQKRLQKRSYNQAALLAKELSRQSGVACSENNLLKVIETVPQQELTARARVRNLAQAFQTRDHFTGNRIMLVDDVMTTGSTVRACSRVLLDAGAENVDVAILGRA